MELQFGYISLSFVMTILLILIGFKTISKTFQAKFKALKKKMLIIGFFLSWHLYIGVLALSNVMLDLSFPPKFFLLTILPAFVGTGIFIYKNRKEVWLKHIPSHVLFVFQSFRIVVEILFLYTVAQGILHPNVTIEGYNFDLVYATTVLFIWALTFKKFKKYKNLIIAWNYLGLLVIAVIIFLFQTTIYLPELYGDIELFPIEFLKYPYILVPSFLMPSAVFIHVLSIVQLKGKV